MDFFIGLLKAAITVLLVVMIWWYYPQFINDLMNVNLQIIAFTASMLPDTYGPQVEATLRLLAGEKALIFFESSLAVKIVFKYVFQL